MTGVSFWQIQQHRGLQHHGTRASAQILNYSPGSHPSVRVRFATAANEQVEATLQATTRGSNAVGAHIDVLYDPADPADSAERADDDGTLAWLWFAGGLVVLVPSTLIFGFLCWESLFERWVRRAVRQHRDGERQ